MAVNNEYLDILARSPVFKDLSEEARKVIAGEVQFKMVEKNVTIFREGDQGDFLYIIRSGSVRVFRRSKEGVRLDISVKGPGDTFGEMALLTGELRSATVETLAETQLMSLSKEQLNRIMQEFPDISKLFLREMRRWLFTDEKRLEKQALEVRQSLRTTWFDYFLVLAVSLVLAVIFNFSNPNGIPFFPKFPDRSSFKVITPAAAHEEFVHGEALFLDARPANFYRQRHIEGAQNIPLSLFDIVYLMTFGKVEKGKKIIIYGGTISQLYDLELADKLILRGYEQVRILEGGMPGWEKMGYPVSANKKE